MTWEIQILPITYEKYLNLFKSMQTFNEKEQQKNLLNHFINILNFTMSNMTKNLVVWEYFPHSFPDIKNTLREMYALFLYLRITALKCLKVAIIFLEIFSSQD